MSLVTLIIVDGDTITMIREHYLKIISILKGAEIPSPNSGHYLDAGYILLDNNLGIVINEQDAFDINRDV